MYPHQHFSALVHALESFHRKTAKGLYVPEVTYQPIFDSLVSAMPPALDSDHRAALKSRLKYGNEYSLNKRLSDLSSTLEPALQNLISPELKAFLGRVVATRNFFTHWELDSQVKPFDSAELPEAAWRLRRFLVILMLSKVGISANALGSRLGSPGETEHP